MKTIIMMALIAILPSLGHGQVLTPRSSDQFSDYLSGRSYEANVLPQNNTGAPFIRSATGTIVTESVSGGFLTFKTESPGTLSYQADDDSPGWWVDNADPAKGFTVEFRVRALSGLYDFNFIASYNNENLENQVLVVEDGATRWGSTVLSSAENDDGFHVFRLVREANVNRYQIWRDGVLVGSNLTGTVKAGNRFWFADWTGQPGGGVVDYVRWDTSGAYSPVPEPSSLATVAGGLLILGTAFARRRFGRG